MVTTNARVGKLFVGVMVVINAEFTSKISIVLTSAAFTVRTQNDNVLGGASKVTVADVPYRMCQDKEPEW